MKVLNTHKLDHVPEIGQSSDFEMHKSSRSQIFFKIGVHKNLANFRPSGLQLH